MSFLAFWIGTTVGIAFGLFWAGRSRTPIEQKDSHEDLFL